MKTIHWILGPGAIGRLLAHSLAPFGQVVVVGRRTLPTQQSLTTPKSRQRVQRLRMTTLAALAIKPHEEPAFVHITTKAMVAEAALEGLKGVVSSSTPLVLWQNGFLAQPRISLAWPGPVLCATTTEGAYLNGDNSVVHAGHGHTFIGDLNSQHGKLAEQIAQKLTQAGLTATKVDDIRDRLWQKLAVNAAINPLVALHGIRNGELRNAPYSALVVAIVREASAIMLAEGIPPPAGKQGVDAWLALVWQVVENTANNKASMRQDIEARRPTERKAIIAPLIESARNHGLAYENLKRLNNALAALEKDYLYMHS